MLKILLILLPVLVESFSPTVVTSKGPIVGQKVKNTRHIPYNTYFGIPYALVDESKPFEDSQEYPKSYQLFNASDPSTKCPQVILSEGGVIQCLRLNIYVPVIRGAQPFSVFVWFHGGGLAFGSAGEYKPALMVQENVIVITANYRLGPYGFLCTSEIQNQGLKDMKNALKWVKENIAAFGGNPDKVTAGGESWGASAIDFLLYDEADFNQAIMESGSRFSFGVSTRVDNEAPIKLATRLGYKATNHKEAIKFLSSADPIEVMRATRDLGIIFGVCERPGDFRLMDKIKTAPILIGYNSKESFADFATQPDEYYTKLNEELYSNLGKLFDLPKDKLRNLTDTVWKFYLGNKSISRESMLEIIDLSSDLRVNHGVERSVSNYLSLGNPNVFKYVFSFTEGSPYENMTGVGAYHTEELRYLFEWGVPLITDWQTTMKTVMIKLWVNFVKNGHPVQGLDPYGWFGTDGLWVPADASTRRYLNIDKETVMRENVYQERIAFWDQIWAEYARYRK